MRRAAVPIVAALLVACATPVTMLTNPATGQVARCGGGSTGFIAGGMIGKSIEQSSDAECVRDYQARGFRTYSEASPSPQAISAAKPAPVAARESKYLFSAEAIAKAKGCSPTTMTAKGAGSESFVSECPAGVALAIRCELDGCRILQ